MTLQEFVNNLNEFIKENPDALNKEVVYAKDDEGNYYYQVIYSPSLGHFEDGDFCQEKGTPNAVCIN